MNTLVLVVFIAAALPAFALGYVMRRRQRVDWISGIDVACVEDPAALARFVGNRLHAIGVAVVSAGLALAFAPADHAGAIVIALVVAIHLLLATLLVGIRRRARHRT